MKSCVGYARKSAVKQDRSIKAQVAAMRRFAVKRGLRIVAEYWDTGKSGKSAKRRKPK